MKDRKNMDSLCQFETVELKTLPTKDSKYEPAFQKAGQDVKKLTDGKALKTTWPMTAINSLAKTQRRGQHTSIKAFSRKGVVYVRLNRNDNGQE